MQLVAVDPSRKISADRPPTVATVIGAEEAIGRAFDGSKAARRKRCRQVVPRYPLRRHSGFFKPKPDVGG